MQTTYIESQSDTTASFAHTALEANTGCREDDSKARNDTSNTSTTTRTSGGIETITQSKDHTKQRS